MIQIGELRAGNWLQSKDDYKTPFQIRDGEDIDDVVMYQCYEFVPLTPEILESAGFVRETPNDQYGVVFKRAHFKFIIRQVNFGRLGKNEFAWSIELSDDDTWETIVSRIDYLHQFQNTYFFLTNKELEINLQTIT